MTLNLQKISHFNSDNEFRFKNHILLGGTANQCCHEIVCLLKLRVDFHVFYTNQDQIITLHQK